MCTSPEKRSRSDPRLLENGRLLGGVDSLSIPARQRGAPASEPPAVARSEQRRPAGRGGRRGPEPPSSRSPRRPQAATSWGGRAAAERAPLLAGRAAAEGRGRRDWRGPQQKGAGRLYQRSPPSRRRQSGCWSAAPPRRPGRPAGGLARGWRGGGRGGPRGGGQRRCSLPRANFAEPGAGSERWRGGSPAHTKEEAAVAAAAAPAMLCYVTRPDAVLMEVEVEAKANGEDCLNQVTTRGQAGEGGRPVPRGRGASRRRQAPGRAFCRGTGGAAAAASGGARPGRPARAPSS